MNELDSTKNVANWPELAISLYEKLTGKNASITYDFKYVNVQVPDRVGQEAVHTPWQINGALTISTSDSN